MLQFLFFALIFLNLSHAQINIKSIGTGIKSIKSLSPISGIDEISDIDELAKNADVFGIGETNHGTTQDSTRHLILRRLVEKNGYRIVLAEHSVPSTIQPIYQNYLRYCVGDPIEFKKNLSSPVFRTKEYDALFKWICEFNKSHPKDPIQFYGFDTRVDAHVMADWIEKLVSIFPNDLKLKLNTQTIRSECFGAKYKSRKDFFDSEEYKKFREIGTIPEKSYKVCSAAIQAINKFIKSKSIILSNKFSKFDYAILKIMPDTLFTLVSDYYLNTHHLPEFQNIRSRQHAKNFLALWQALGPHSKVVFFAHNYHIAKHQSELNYKNWPKIKSAGEWLNDLLGSRYRNVGLTQYYSKSYYLNEPAISNQPESLDNYLNRSQQDYFIINPKGSFFKVNDKWIIHAEDKPITISRQFDLLIYQRSAPESFPVP